MNGATYNKTVQLLNSEQLMAISDAKYSATRVGVIISDNYVEAIVIESIELVDGKETKKTTRIESK